MGKEEVKKNWWEIGKKGSIMRERKREREAG